MTSMNSSLWLTQMDLREQKPVLYLQVCSYHTFIAQLKRISHTFLLIRWFFWIQIGTGSDVKVPKKPERPKSTYNYSHSSANQREAAPTRKHSSSEDTPIFKSGRSLPSQGKSSAFTDSNSINQNGSVEETNIPEENNNKESHRVSTAANNSVLKNNHQHKDLLSSPQKHREKRKHCDSDEKRKHKKTKRSREARFEGHRISHLVKKRAFKKEEAEENGANDQKKSDDYVLSKLLKKSGRNPVRVVPFTLTWLFSFLTSCWFC